MPAYQVCQNFFQDALAPFHKYRQTSEKQQNAKLQKAFLDALAEAVNPKSRVLIIYSVAQMTLSHGKS
ncbi:transposase [Salmonella enterica subsp. indica]|uniref:Uncharacterized protein n=2 Tax=Salmonella enterica TaxID=28901 RepID=A0A701YTQ4_SALER|nr:hypothetical protein [Salmonella enterica subsp. indica serovar 11:b:e,n,x]ECC3877082.1 hypothetical protein [Salmonella enterica subsp. indica]SUI01105.1 transposase [Salmonella enterica subsp. indica]HAC6564273.1 hypothetical protein [Salmonella enterica subsp. indica]